MKKGIYRWIFPIGVMISIFYLSSQSTLPKLGPGFAWDDKAAHFIAYFVLALTLWYALAGSRRRALYTVLIAVVFGMSDEYHQSFVPGRSCDVLDLLADTIGIFILVASAIILRRVKNGGKRKRNQSTNAGNKRI